MALASLTLTLTTLTACGGPSAGDVADSLAKGLASGKLDAVPFTGTTAKRAGAELTSITAGLSKLSETVSVTSVRKPAKDSTGANATTATLKHTWKVPAGPGRTGTWTYDTTAQLVEGDQGWAVRWAPSLVADVTAGDTLSLQRSQPARADINGAGNVALVTNRPVVRFGIDRGAIPAAQAPASARALAALLGINADSYAGQVVKAGPKQFVEGLVLRADSVPPAIRATYPTIPGATAIQGQQSLAPTREFARPILGSVGAVTAELLKKNPDYAASDQVGLSGLQARYDSRLAGQPGVAVVASGSGGPAHTLFKVPAVPGSPLQTTFDPTIESNAETLLAGVKPASAIVVIKPSTGEVLAAASGPGGQGYSTSTLGRYAPGSTFKLVTSLALLRSGLTPDSPVECPGTITVNGRAFGNDSDFPANGAGTMTLRQALAESCNTAFIGTALKQKISPDQLASAAASLGFGWDAKASGADVFTGSAPTDASATENAAAFIGQGKVTASPIAMAAVAASIVNGSPVTPRLVDDPAPPAATAPAKPLTAAEAAELRSMMAAVVTSGTGRVLAGLGGSVIAKTGTAEYGNATPPAVHAWMVAARGDLAVCVLVADGQSGAKTAGPIMRQMLSALPG